MAPTVAFFPLAPDSPHTVYVCHEPRLLAWHASCLTPHMLSPCMPAPLPSGRDVGQHRRRQSGRDPHPSIRTPRRKAGHPNSPMPRRVRFVHLMFTSPMATATPSSPPPPNKEAKVSPECSEHSWRTSLSFRGYPPVCSRSKATVFHGPMRTSIALEARTTTLRAKATGARASRSTTCYPTTPQPIASPNSTSSARSCRT